MKVYNVFDKPCSSAICLGKCLLVNLTRIRAVCIFFFFLRVGGGLRLDYVRPFFWCLPSNCFLVYSKCFFLIAFYMAVNKKVAYLTKTSIKKKHRSATTLSTLFIRQLIK